MRLLHLSTSTCRKATGSAERIIMSPNHLYETILEFKMRDNRKAVCSFSKEAKCLRATFPANCITAAARPVFLLQVLTLIMINYEPESASENRLLITWRCVILRYFHVCYRRKKKMCEAEPPGNLPIRN